MRKVIVAGIGQTKFVSKSQETSAELCFQATHQALQDSGLSVDDIDAVVFGCAPDAFDGIHQMGENVIEACGAKGKPFIRNHFGGATGVATAIVGWWHIASGVFDNVLIVAEQRMSPPTPHAQEIFIRNWDEMYHRPLRPNVVRMASLEMTRYMHDSGATKEALYEVAVKNRNNAFYNPHAQLPKKFTREEALKSRVLTWPVSLADISPTSDGAVSAVLVAKDAAKKMRCKKIEIAGVGWCAESVYWETRGMGIHTYLEKSARQAYKMAKIKAPQKEIKIANVYDPFTYKECHHAEGLLLCKKGDGWKLAPEGISQKDGKLPINPHGGLLGGGNPIAAAGMMQFVEMVRQLRGEGNLMQVNPIPSCGLAHAWGGLFQFSAVVVCRN